MFSAIYEGTVRHRRFAPVKNEFSYGLFMMYLDLAELNEVFRDFRLWSVDRPNLACLRRRDHVGDPAVPLDEAVRGAVTEHTHARPAGPIRLLTHLRYFGHCFNPVSFFYCFDSDDTRVETIIAEITNTPWGERYCYILPEVMNEHRGRWKRYRFPKTFHVSPFIDMDVDYDWRFSEPGERLQIHMEDFRQGDKFFDATLSLRRRPITGAGLAHVLARYPLMTVQVLAKIYWQALRLRIKRAPVYPRPTERQARHGGSS